VLCMLCAHTVSERRPKLMTTKPCALDYQPRAPGDPLTVSFLLGEYLLVAGTDK
jgi:hypothetical protein